MAPSEQSERHYENPGRLQQHHAKLISRFSGSRQKKVRSFIFLSQRFSSLGIIDPMQGKTEGLLYMLLWTCDSLAHPTLRNLGESFEAWAYRHGFLRQLQRLEKQQFLQGEAGTNGDRLHRLTEAGRLHALGGRDPEASWRRPWDGQWRLVLFDVPENRRTARNALRAYLRSRSFGYLQNSVWITPDPVDWERDLLSDGSVNVQSLILMEARPCAGERDAEIVEGSWDFADINRHYAKHHQILLQRPRGEIDAAAAAKCFAGWLNEERQAWLDVIWRDPLLPKRLLPDGYAGVEAWHTRLACMEEAGQQMRSFKSGERRDKK